MQQHPDDSGSAICDFWRHQPALVSKHSHLQQPTYALLTYPLINLNFTILYSPQYNSSLTPFDLTKNLLNVMFHFLFSRLHE